MLDFLFVWAITLSSVTILFIVAVIIDKIDGLK